jgi:urea transporter
MDAGLTWWRRACGASAALRFIDINLRGCGQVMFQDHPLTGALFVAAIAWGAFAAGTPEVLAGGLLGLVVATLSAMRLKVDAGKLAAGLYGYNGLLVGMALATFLPVSAALWFYVVLGAAVSVVVMLATARATQGWQLSALTAPFVVVTWLLLLSAQAFAGLDSGIAADAVQPLEPAAADALDLGAFVVGVLKSISQVFLKASVVAALLFLAGLWVSSPAAALFALGGALLAVTSAHLLGAESDLVRAGLLGFSPVLTAVALGTVFYKPGWRVAVYAALGTLFTVITQAALNVLFLPLAVPALTAPFVLVTWLFLMPQQALGDDGHDG